MYTSYAPYYDQGLFHFSVLMYGYIRDVLRQHAAPAGAERWIDLACGTGTLALMLADDHWDVLGIDGSRAMLEQARAKVSNDAEARWLRFRRADMRDWQVSEPVDVISCCFDSINYLLEPESLAHTFACCYQALKPGGLWLFDMNTPYFLEHIWSPVEIEDHDAYTLIMQTRFAPEQCISTMTLHGFVKQANGLYDLFQEQHQERGYELTCIQTCLEQQGFKVEAVYDCFTLSEPVMHSHRWFWVARKP